MEKMMWAKPELNEVVFAANEYVAACGDSGTTYWFECDAAAGSLYYYRDMNLNNYKSDKQDASSPLNWTTEQWDQKNATLLGSYHPCDAEHEASTGQGFFWGFIDWFDGHGKGDDGRDNMHDSGETVIVWRGENGNNGHATTNLDISTWEIAKS